MRVLLVGDIVGKPGREAAIACVPSLRSKWKATVVIANGENAANGMGITGDLAEDLFRRGKIDVMTLGNHAFAKREGYEFLDNDIRVLRPANFPPAAPGRGAGIFHTQEGDLGVVSMQGRTFMEPLDDPFRMIDTILEGPLAGVRCVVVDFHAEATSEKAAFAMHVDGRVSAVIGTHTHVQTADERILSGGTAFLTDMGMTGPVDSVIGMDPEIILHRFRTLTPAKFEVARGRTALNGVFVEIDSATGRATHIERIQMPVVPPAAT
jgi:metallophosphoesterase (TIGR00282 family)